LSLWLQKLEGQKIVSPSTFGAGVGSGMDKIRIQDTG